MNAAENLAIAVPLSWSEISERYPQQWVCFIDVEEDPITGPDALAFVLSADPSLAEALRQIGDTAVGYAHTGRRRR